MLEKIDTQKGEPDDVGRGQLNQLLVLLCLTGLAMTEPILTIFGTSPEIFYFYNVDSQFFIILYALAVATIPAVSLWLASALAGLFSQTLSKVIHYSAAGLLSAIWVVQLAKWSFGIADPAILAVLGLAGGAVFLLTYTRWSVVNTGLQFTAIIPLVTVGVFLFSSNTGSLMQKTEIDISTSGSDSKHPSILFILMDEFPTLGLFNEEGDIDEVRFPNLADLSNQATWYRHYSILAGQTRHSVPSILTGNYPKSISPSMDNFPDNIFTLLAPTHDFTTFEALTGICGLPKCSEGQPGAPIETPEPRLKALFSITASLMLQRISLTDKGEARLDDFKEKLTTVEAESKATNKKKHNVLFDPANQVNLAQAKPERLNKFVDTLIDSENAAFYFLHLELPHVPWRFYQNGQLYDLPFARPPFSPRNNDGGEWMSKLSEHRFLLQAEYVDLLLGDIFSQMKSLGIWDDTLVVVTADHGRSFKPGTVGRVLTPQTFDTIAYTPLFIKEPLQQVGQIDDSNMMAYDIVPTVADILGVDISWEADGLPAGHPEIAARGDDKVYFPKKKPNKFGSKLAEKQGFSDKVHFPEYSSRGIGVLPEGGNPLSALNKTLGLDDYFGRSPNEFEIEPGGRASVDELTALQVLPEDKRPLGVVMGNLEFDPSGDTILVSINDRFVTGSPLIEFKEVANTFVAMLPNDALESQNEIRVFLVEDRGLLELQLE